MTRRPSPLSDTSKLEAAIARCKESSEAYQASLRQLIDAVKRYESAKRGRL